MKRWWVAMLAWLVGGPAAVGGDRADRASDGGVPVEARQRLLDDVDRNTRETASWTGIELLSAPVREAMRRVPRERFVDEPLRSRAFSDRPLGIGHGQTISQPFIVALMTELLEPHPGDRILEVGTGSGYQAAVLASLVGQVHSIEIVAPLAERARATLDALGVANVEIRVGDGHLGWPEAAPFDGIVVTAAPPAIPPALIEQLKPGGRLVIPVGTQGGDQELQVIRKRADGGVEVRRGVPVSFVPMTR